MVISVPKSKFYAIFNPDLSTKPSLTRIHIMESNNQLFAERFLSARKLNGMSLQDLAEKLEEMGFKISRQSLHKYEQGEVLPNSEVISKLSKAMNLRSDHFFRETKVEIGEVEFRKFTHLPAKDETRIIEQTKEYLSRYLELEEIMNIKSEFKNPIQHSVSSFEDVEKAAKDLRKTWKLGSDSLNNVFELLEDYHIKIVELEAGDGFDGMQTWANGNIPVIVINSLRVKKSDRKRFTAFHELGHLILNFKKGLTLSQRETLCNQFAGAMLFSKDAAEKELGSSRQRLNIQELVNLKKQYGISIQAIVMRLKDLGIISDNYCRQFFFYLKQMDWKIEEPVDYPGIEKSNRFDQLIYRALAEEQISMSKAAALKNMILAEFLNKSQTFE